MLTGYRTQEISLYWYVADFQGRAEDLESTDSLEYSIYYSESGWTSVVGSTPVDLTAARVSLGRYKVEFTPAADAEIGQYFIQWVETRSSGVRTVLKEFEIVSSFDPYLRTLNQYSLALVRDIRDLGISSSDYSDRKVMQAIIKAAQYMERMCGRRFGSRYTTINVDTHKQVNGSPLRLPEYCAWLQRFGSEDSPDADLSLTKLYSRAIREEIGAPAYGADDRDNPKIDGYDYLRTKILVFTAEDFIRITGLWGYVDPDGSDSGKVPEGIRAAVIKVTQKFLGSVMGDGDTTGTSFPADRVIKEKTATQSYELNRLDEGGLEFSKYVLSGDTELAKTILQYRRPLQGGLARRR